MGKIAHFLKIQDSSSYALAYQPISLTESFVLFGAELPCFCCNFPQAFLSSCLLWQLCVCPTPKKLSECTNSSWLRRFAKPI
jgi:hypothetical protein